MVGAGPAGVYSAYRLRNSGKKVGLFEFSDRVGGRVYSYTDMPGVDFVEQGAMRYLDQCHGILQGLIRELGELKRAAGTEEKTHCVLYSSITSYLRKMCSKL